MKGDWGVRPNSGNISEDVQNLLSLTIDVCEELKSDIECKYIAYLLVSATRGKKFSRKWGIYKFLYIDKPLKQLTSKLSGKKFRLYDYIPRSEIWKLQRPSGSTVEGGLRFGKGRYRRLDPATCCAL